VLRAADLVTCTILGHKLGMGVPEEQGPDATASTGFGGGNVKGAMLRVTHEMDGSVLASCKPGSP
jgi:hypothetical protein